MNSTSSLVKERLRKTFPFLICVLYQKSNCLSKLFFNSVRAATIQRKKLSWWFVNNEKSFFKNLFRVTFATFCLVWCCVFFATDSPTRFGVVKKNFFQESDIICGGALVSQPKQKSKAWRVMAESARGLIRQLFFLPCRMFWNNPKPNREIVFRSHFHTQQWWALQSKVFSWLRSTLSTCVCFALGIFSGRFCLLVCGSRNRNSSIFPSIFWIKFSHSFPIRREVFHEPH